MLAPGQQMPPPQQMLGPPMNGQGFPMSVAKFSGPPGHLGSTASTVATATNASGVPLLENGQANNLVEGQPLIPMGRQSPQMNGQQQQNMKQLEETIESVLRSTDPHIRENSIMDFFDACYQRFFLKYGNEVQVRVLFEDHGANDLKLQLLQAIRTGDIPSIYHLIDRADLNWNFIYPPRKVKLGKDGKSQKTGPEGWCRSPLCLLILPDDSIMDRMLPDVDNEKRIELIKKALRNGADPDFPPVYWANPAVFACMDGDLDVLKLLEDYGCNLEQKVEFGKQPRPAFTLVHAAAMNGNLNVLKYLEEKLPPEVFSALDAENSNPLHILMSNARDLDSAMFLLDHGCDAFAFNDRKQSAFSLAIEFLPELAKELMSRKSKIAGKWMGRTMYAFTFTGIVLPLSPNGGPLEAKDSSGESMGLEEMMIAYEARDLCVTPLVQNLLDMKWEYFGKNDYVKRLAPYVLFVASLFVMTTAPAHSQLFKVFTMLGVPLVLNEIWGIVTFAGHTGFWRKLDVSNITMAVLAISYKLCHWFDIDIPKDEKWVHPAFAIISMTLQLTVTVRSLRLIVVDKYVGPLLIAVAQMGKDTFPWLVLAAVTVFGLANAFYVLVHSHPEGDMPEDDGFDWSYVSVVQALILAASSMDPTAFLEMPKVLEKHSTAVYMGGWFLFWTFTAIAVLMLFNLLIALYNTAYVNIVEGHGTAYWAFLRLQLLVFAEADRSQQGVKDYYRDLQRFDGRRTFMRDLDEGS